MVQRRPLADGQPRGPELEGLGAEAPRCGKVGGQGKKECKKNVFEFIGRCEKIFGPFNLFLGHCENFRVVVNSFRVVVNFSGSL